MKNLKILLLLFSLSFLLTSCQTWKVTIVNPDSKLTNLRYEPTPYYIWTDMIYTSYYNNCQKEINKRKNKDIKHEKRK